MVSSESKTSSHRSEKSTYKRRAKPPLDQTALRDLALSYAARFATTAAKLENYLARKIRERGIAEVDEGRPAELDPAPIIARMVELGYIDDDAYARSRSRDLAERGYGKRRIDQALYVAGVAEETRNAHTPGEAQLRMSAALMAAKRRFGPYSREACGFGAGDAPDEDEDEDEGDGSAERHARRQAAQKKRDKQIAALLRAGHDLSHACFIVDAASEADIEEWIAEAEED